MCHSEFFRAVLLVSVGGMVGGLLYWTSTYLSSVVKSRTDAEASPFSPTWQFCLANAFTGIGGAWAVLLALLWATRAPLDSSTKEMLELIATAMVAGYAGNRVLPAVADRLLKELIEKSAKDTVVAAAAAKTDADSAKRSRLIAEVLAYLDLKGNQTEHQTARFVGQLKDEFRLDPQFRSAAILLARLYAESMNDKQAAVDVLLAFIEGKRKAGAMDDSDIADAYWNLANYYEEQFKAEPTKRSYRDSAIEALRESLRVVPSYRASLQADADFQDLLSDSKASTLLT